MNFKKTMAGGDKSRKGCKSTPSLSEMSVFSGGYRLTPFAQEASENDPWRVKC